MPAQDIDRIVRLPRTAIGGVLHPAGHRPKKAPSAAGPPQSARRRRRWASGRRLRGPCRRRRLDGADATNRTTLRRTYPRAQVNHSLPFVIVKAVVKVFIASSTNFPVHVHLTLRSVIAFLYLAPIWTRTG